MLSSSPLFPLLRSVSGVFTDHSNATASPSHSLSFFRTTRFQSPISKSKSKSISISFHSSSSSSLIIRSSTFSHHSNTNHNHNDDFLQASLLLPETITHYHMWRNHFQDQLHRNSSAPSIPLPIQEKNSTTDYNNNSFIRQGFLQRFPNPTIFLKISCDGDYILPIVVGPIAIETLIDAEAEQENGDGPDQFQFVKNLVERLDHEVIMVKITERMVSTYFARLYLSQPGRGDIISVDARPSDAINVANRCKAPIYVSKQIVLADAIRLGYGFGRVRSKKPIYDVLLDSPVDGPDLVAQELSMMHNMHKAIRQERFKDAATWRDKLANLRKSTLEH